LVTANTETLNSGKEVEKPTKTNPIVVFPKPVISETLTEFLIVISLPIIKKSIEISKMSVLPNIPNSSNIVSAPTVF
jgi:hypothetical protein